MFMTASVDVVFAARCHASTVYAFIHVVCLVCVCVCVSVTFVHSVETNRHIFNNFSPLGSHAILVFPYQMAWQYSNGNPPPLTGASNAGGVGRNRDFKPLSGFTVCCELWQRQVQYTATWRVYNTSRWWAAEFVDGGKQRRSVWQEASTLRRRQRYAVVNLKPK